ncbi:MAG: 50S ribosomal protein L30 [Bacteroidales bacterium]|jgi:large subunit ribosomal protein L30|nr:50S ribosomal protein L30 [Bacteroidales bacterium]
MEKIKITQIQSIIDRPKNQRLVMKALGLTRMHKTVEHNATPQILGMVEKVKHLVKVENV